MGRDREIESEREKDREGKYVWTSILLNNIAEAYFPMNIPEYIQYSILISNTIDMTWYDI